jgi:hypothetical protein
MKNLKLCPETATAGSNKGNQCREDKCSNQIMEHFGKMLHSENPDVANHVKHAVCVITKNRCRLRFCGPATLSV